MDLLSQHEAFLRAIFDAPDDDTPRLVYADFLQENGEDDRAQFIRWQCGYGEKPKRLPINAPNGYSRGLPWGLATYYLTPDQLRDPGQLRRDTVHQCPELFSVVSITFGGRFTSAEPFDTLFGLAAFARVTELVFVGEEVADPADDLGSGFQTYSLNPVITTRGVEALAQHRGARRLTALDLRNNDLDNDAARAIAKSPFLDNLKRLRLLEGNRLRGRVWQQVIERFGEDVVG